MSSKPVSTVAVTLVLASGFGAIVGLIGTGGPSNVTRSVPRPAEIRLTTREGHTAVSRSELARRDVAHLLSLVRLPGGARRVALEPKGDDSLLSSPGETIGDPDLVDLHRFYVVAASPTSLDAFVLSHRPAGSKTSGYGSGSLYASTDEWFASFSWAPRKALLDSRTLVLSIAGLPGNRCGLRVDAEVTWLPAKPPGDVIAKGAKVITVVLSAGLNPGEAAHRPVSTNNPAKIEAIRTFINNLGVFPPGIRHCPADFGQTLSISFAKSDGAPAFDLVVADTSGCEEITVWHRGHAVEPRLGGALAPFVEHELGFS